MKKLLLILSFILFIIVNLNSQILLYENLGESTSFKVLIPSDICNFKHPKITTLKLTVEIYHKDVLMLSRYLLVDWHYIENLKHTEYLVHLFNEKLYPGSYEVKIKIQNEIHRVNVEKRYPLIIDNQMIKSSNIHILKYYNNNLLYPSRLFWQDQADSVYVQIDLAENPVKIDLNHNEKLLTSLTPAKNVFQKIDLEMDENIENIFTVRVYFEDEIIFKNFKPFTKSILISQNYSYRKQLQQLRYVMSQNEYEFIRRLNDDELPYQIELFWRKNDPSPQKLHNELRELFYDRVKYSDENFAIKGYLSGWQTDRGMIYIKYGKPDEIQTESFMIGKYPVIIWIYYSLDKRFYFDDKKGFGFYELRENWYNN
ncbi:MAG: GWxTD domain-containing protein [Candidatus Cloacimonetes bacterium]|nr:GWxTD domain-containing protein [Candidatus Cloacimonadota bacterium]